MSWAFYPARTTFSQYAEDWDRLNARLYDAHPYFDSRFVGPLLKYFTSGNETLCIYRSRGSVEGALILQRTGGGRWSSFRPSQAQVTPILIGDVRLLNTLPEALPGVAWTIEFLAVDPRYAPDFSGLELEKIVTAYAYTIGVEPGIGFADYWAHRSKNLKANIRRYLNRAEKEFDVPVLAKSTAPTDMRGGVHRFGELESAGWKAAAGTAVSIENKQGEFYAEVLSRFALTDQAEVCELSIGGQLAASRLVISNRQMVVILKTAYNESLARFAPSRLLLYRLLEKQLTDQPGRAVEFYTNATNDQIEWATFGCTVQNIQVFKSDALAAIYTIVKVFRRILRGANNRRETSENTLPAVEVKACSSVEGFAAEHYSLQEFAASDNIEASIDWFDLLQKQIYPDDQSIRYYFIAENKRPTTILPLRLTTKGGVRTVESLGNYYTSLYSPLLTKDSDLLTVRHMLAAATREHAGAHVMRFAPMDPASPAYKGLLNELRASGWIPLTFFCFGNWFLRVEGTWDTYLKQRSANLRSSIKRRTREFVAEDGTLEVVTGADGLDQAIAAFQEVYSASWKKPEPYTDFVPSLVRMLASKGMLRLGVARLQNKPIAAQLWIVGEGKASIYKVAYHHAYASLSPGTVLTSYLLRHVIEEDQVKEVDFLIGDDDYKKIWMSDRRERWGIVAFNPRTIIGSGLFIREVAGRVAKSAGQKTRAFFSKSQHAYAALTHLWTAVRIDPVRTHNAQRDQLMAWTIYPIKQFSEFADQWDALARSRLGTPFLESGFLQPLIDVFASGDERLCLFHSSGRLRAAAIMQRGRKGLWQTFQPSQLPLGAWISDGRIDLISACRGLMQQLPGLTLGVGISQMDPRIQSRPNDSAKLRTLDYIYIAWVDIEGGFENYWEARGKNLKQNTRKQRNKLQAEGIKTRIECITTPEDVNKAIEDYGLLEGAGWKGADGTAILPDNDQGRFYRKMLENFCAAGRGRIYRYWFGEKVVAMDLCIHDDEAIAILKTAYDESYKAVSPSTLMRQDEFQLLFEEQQFKRIEFFGKIMEWHTRWTTQSRTIYHATHYRWDWLKNLHMRLNAPAVQESPGQPSSAQSQA